MLYAACLVTAAACAVACHRCLRASSSSPARMSCADYADDITYEIEMAISSKWEALEAAAVVLAHVLGVAAFGIVLYHEKSTGDIPWESPGLHPVLMMFGFVWLGPWGAMAYRTYEKLLGMSHARAKMLHLLLQTFALFFGLLGVTSKYKGSAVHFRSLHSQMGILVTVLYVVQWIGGFTTFFLPGFAPLRLKRAMVPIHAFTGSVSLILTLAVVYSGVVSYVGKSTDAQNIAPNDLTKFDRFNAAAFLTVLMGVLVMAVLSKRGNGGNGTTVAERAPLVNEKPNNLDA